MTELAWEAAIRPPACSDATSPEHHEGKEEATGKTYREWIEVIEPPRLTGENDRTGKQEQEQSG